MVKLTGVEPAAGMAIKANNSSMPFFSIKLGGDMKNLLRLTAVFSMIMLLCSCATSSNKPLFSIEESLVIKGYTVVGPVNSINNYRINGWSYVSEKFVIINTGVVISDAIFTESNRSLIRYLARNRG